MQKSIAWLWVDRLGSHSIGLRALTAWVACMARHNDEAPSESIGLRGNDLGFCASYMHMSHTLAFRQIWTPPLYWPNKWFTLDVCSQSYIFNNVSNGMLNPLSCLAQSAFSTGWAGIILCEHNLPGGPNMKVMWPLEDQAWRSCDHWMTKHGGHVTTGGPNMEVMWPLDDQIWFYSQSTFPISTQIALRKLPAKWSGPKL